MSQEPLPGASPAAPLITEIRGLNRERSYPYRPLAPYTWVLLGLLSLYVLAIVGSFVAGMVSAFASGGVPDDLAAITALTIGGLYILCAIAGGFWIYNAACNIRALGARGLEVSPGWAVGFYAIPIVSWFKPFQAMNEIDRASRAPESWRSQGTRIVLRLWWATWLITGIGGGILNVIQRADPDDASAIGILSLAVTASGLAATAFFFTVVLSVHRAQAQTRARGSELAQVFA